MIFRFIARLGMDVSEFVAGAKKATATSDKMKADMQTGGKAIAGAFSRIGPAIAGVFSLQAISSYAQHMSQTVGEIKDMADLLEISTDEVQQLQKAAAGSGQSFEIIAMAMQRIQQLRAQAQAGEKGPSGLFAILGIDPSKGSASDIIKQALAASSRGVNENAAAFDLLGKKAANLRMVFSELDQQGPIKVLSEDDMERIDQTTKRLEKAIHSLKVASAPVLSKTIETGATMFNMFNPSVSEQIREIGRRGSAGEFGLLKEAELKAMAMMGIKDEEGKTFEALDLNAALARRGSRTSNVDIGSAILRSAIANEATFKLLQDRTK